MINLEYWKAYVRTMPTKQFNYIVNIAASILGITLVLINPYAYIVIALLSMAIATYKYYKGE